MIPRRNAAEICSSSSILFSPYSIIRFFTSCLPDGLQFFFVFFDHFTTIDRTKTNIVPIHQKKPQVVSKHPANSYEIVMDDTDKSVAAYLRITDPAQFWKYTKYLVITTR